MNIKKIAPIAIVIIVVPLLNFIGGCALLQKFQTEEKHGGDNIKKIIGRVSARVGDKGHGASFVWEKRVNADIIRISTSLGGSIAEIAVRESGASLKTRKGKVFRASSASALTEPFLGWPLPASGLKFWIVGSVDPVRGIENVKYDNLFRLKSFSQGEWEIEFRSYFYGSPQPRKLFLSYDSIELRIVVDHTNFKEKL